MSSVPRGSSLDARIRWYGWTITKSGCWEWNGTRRKRVPYGVLQWRGACRDVHRLAYETWVGPIPEGHVVRHKCDNPPCINPEHLETGTHRDNANDKMIRGRHRCLSGEQHGNAKLLNQDVIDIRESYAKGYLTQQMLAEIFGVSASNINLIVNRKNWRH